ncbi:fam-l protein [Plasmodium malariae]|uniref:Fam-l protein n=1 Tax=Plasmodium malariae TaxID=5858 RepID=A0A1D3P9Z9_PLAMA|nr:fam-l protein [Plasmodium malariae]SCN12021.1 fam-l protein [Plasmodium malariae]
MDERMKLLFLINLAMFIFLSWRGNFTSELSTFKKYLDENYKGFKKLDTRIYRLLSKYRKNINSCVLGLREVIPYNVENEKINICNNVKRDRPKKSKSNGCSLKNEEIHKLDKKSKSCIFETKKYSRLEKKIFKELDYENFLKSNRTISDKLYKRIVLKKYGLRLRLPLLLFFLLLLSLILDYYGGIGLLGGLREVLNAFAQGFWRTLGPKLSILLGKDWSETLKPFFEVPVWKSDSLGTKIRVSCTLFGFLIYFIPFIILGVTLITWVIYYHKKVKKFEKIKLRKK